VLERQAQDTSITCASCAQVHIDTTSDALILEAFRAVARASRGANRETG